MLVYDLYQSCLSDCMDMRVGVLCVYGCTSLCVHEYMVLLVDGEYFRVCDNI